MTLGRTVGRTAIRGGRRRGGAESASKGVKPIAAGARRPGTGMNGEGPEWNKDAPARAAAAQRIVQ
jgi:hypothetical protein